MKLENCDEVYVSAVLAVKNPLQIFKALPLTTDLRYEEILNYLSVGLLSSSHRYISVGLIVPLA
jgi:hypothetical protein